MTIRALALAALATFALSAPISTAAFAQTKAKVDTISIKAKVTIGDNKTTTNNQNADRNIYVNRTHGNNNTVNSRQNGKTNSADVVANGDRNTVNIKQRERR